MAELSGRSRPMVQAQLFTLPCQGESRAMEESGSQGILLIEDSAEDYQDERLRTVPVVIFTTSAQPHNLVQRGHTTPKEITVISQTPLTILLVDDSTADRALYRHFLSSTATYTFLEAVTGEEGLHLCQTTQPDCLLLDFYLPDMDGFEFLDTLQVETAALSYPVVMLTGQGSEQLAVQSMHRGVQDYVVKDDLSAGTLRRVIANVVDQFRLQQMVQTHRSLLQE